ncbi:aldo/keto reductase [Calothrix sp. NIES-3974]|uniref:aldo/keto reductase n=1 Tax=Calothrix sp. NIES-3974 TaxID=2005462 RepID=UPI000B5E567C|nr:aldo/keto reductase [Calothrix sp. NIES-3974]BAZ06681.1 aldo/keto reductase [Calothrix sp. NIES-3974]
MKYNQLGNSDLLVSEICLGTMTYGQQNTIEQAHAQLDLAVDAGINFIDTAEMYPVPPRAETYSLTETYLGHWLKHQPRDKVIIATKIVGAGRSFKWIRDGSPRVDAKNIQAAVEASLQRLQTDYIDLYQIHWPDRYVPIFGNTNFDLRHEREQIPIEEQLTAFDKLIQAGKIRYIGLSNETPWGVCEFCQQAEKLGLPKVISIQNAYNLINRTFEMGLAEACYRENVGLLAYSPLAFGYLTGKHVQLSPPQSRLAMFPGFGQRYTKINVKPAVTAYTELAQKYHLSPTALALAFVRSRWFVSSTIIGATTIPQLQENINSININLTPEIEAEIEAIHLRYPNPAP